MFLHEGSNCEDLALFFSFFFSSQMKTHPTTKMETIFPDPNPSLQKQHILMGVKQTIMRRVY